MIDNKTIFQGARFGREAGRVAAGVIIFVSLCVATPLAAQSNGMLILPFRVEGDPERAGFSSTRISERMQAASHFLLPNLRDTALYSTAETRRILNEADWRERETLDSRRAGELCSLARAGYLLAGSVSFLPGGRIVLGSTTWICRTGQTAASVREATEARHFQRSLRELLVAATPFLAPRRATGAAVGAGVVDVAVVLDQSGSMVEDMPLILKALGALQQRLPQSSRLGVVTVGDGDRLDVVPFSDGWAQTLSLVGERAVRGEVSLTGIERALGIVQSYREWRGRRKVLVFSDARLGTRRSGFESHLRRLQAGGADLHLFCLLNQRYSDRLEWQRMARAMNLGDPAVLYGREAGFVDQAARFILMQGDRFFTSRRDLRGAILRGEVPPSEIVPLETIHYEREELNLVDLPKAFARKNGTQLSYLGPIVSSLETTIARAATAGVVAGASGTRVLVKNAGVSFWIRVNDRRIATQLRQNVGQKLYVGLHVAPATGAGEKLVNLPDPVYIRSQGEVPELFISTWAELSARSERDLSRDNVYFLLLEILEPDDGPGSQDIRH